MHQSFVTMAPMGAGSCSDENKIASKYAGTVYIYKLIKDHNSN